MSGLPVARHPRHGLCLPPTLELWMHSIRSARGRYSRSDSISSSETTRSPINRFSVNFVHSLVASSPPSAISPDGERRCPHTRHCDVTLICFLIDCSLASWDYPPGWPRAAGGSTRFGRITTYSTCRSQQECHWTIEQRHSSPAMRWRRRWFSLQNAPKCTDINIKFLKFSGNNAPSPHLARATAPFRIQVPYSIPNLKTVHAICPSAHPTVPSGRYSQDTHLSQRDRAAGCVFRP